MNTSQPDSQIATAVLFGTVHIYQGWKQTIVIAVFGAMFGTLAVNRRSLKPGMMAHSFQDAAVGIVFSIIGK
jgi:membrane protease YdiL (CAAX protease family)